ncbi:MAG: hypothetical protein R3B09_10720 [Nannocystaceae bacterium]
MAPRRLILAAALLAGCATPFTVVEHPLAADRLVPAEAPRRSPRMEVQETAAAREAEPSRYWSAYAFLDPTHLVELWGSNPRADFLLISARATLPTYRDPITRELPLYTVERGTISAHSGVDLLYRFPVAIDARDQVTITVEIKYLKGKRALDLTRKILAQGESIAAPFLGNYPLATEILGGAKALVDDLVEESSSPNTFRFSLQPGDFRGRSLRVYVLQSEAKRDKRRPLTLEDVVECDDRPGALCRAPKAAEGAGPGEATARASASPELPFGLEGPAARRPGPAARYSADHVKDFAYLTLRFEPSLSLLDPLLLVEAGALSCAAIDRRSIDAARDHLEVYKHTYSPQDVTAARYAHDLAESIVRARELAADRRYGDMLDLLSARGDQVQGLRPPVSESLLVHIEELGRCYDELWQETSPGREILAAWRLFRPSSAASGSRYVKGSSASPGGGGPARATSDRERLSAIAELLGSVAALKGVSYDPGDPRSWEGEGGALLTILRGEALVLSRRQEDATEVLIGAEGPRLCTSDRIGGLFKAELSAACTRCVARLAKQCGRGGVSVESIAATARDHERGVVRSGSSPGSPGSVGEGEGERAP